MSDSSPCVPLEKQELKEAVAHNLAENQNRVSNDVQILDHKFGLYKATFKYCTLVPHDTSKRGPKDPFLKNPYVSDEVNWSQGYINRSARYYTAIYKYGTKKFYVFFEHKSFIANETIPKEFNPSKGFPNPNEDVEVRLFYGFVTRRSTVLQNIKGLFQDGQSGQLFFVVNPSDFKLYQCRYLQLLGESDFSFKRVYDKLTSMKEKFVEKIEEYQGKLEKYATENGIDMSTVTGVDVEQLSGQICDPFKHAMMGLVTEYRDKLLFEAIGPGMQIFAENILEHLALDIILSAVVIPFPLGMVHIVVSKITDKYLEKEVSKLAKEFNLLVIDFVQFNYNIFVGDYMRKAHTI